MVNATFPTLGIVTCSRSDYLGLTRTLKSLSHATASFQQLILVLSDYSESEIQSLKTTYSNLTFDLLIVKPNGIYDAMNQGTKKLRTKYVLFLNGGDELINPNGLIQLTNQVGLNSWGYGALAIAEENSAKIRKYSFNTYSKSLHRFAIKYVPHPSTIFSSQMLLDLGGYDVDFSTAADQDLIHRFARNSHPTVLKDSISKFYLGGQSSRTNLETIGELRKISQNNFGTLLNSDYIDQLFWKIISASRDMLKKIQNLKTNRYRPDKEA